MLNQSYKHITEIDHYIDNEDSKKNIVLVEIERVENKWLLYIEGEKVFSRNTLKEISKILFYMRSHLYDNGSYIVLYDINKRSLIKVGYKHMNRVLKALEVWQEENSTWKYNLKKQKEREKKEIEKMYKKNLKLRRQQIQPIKIKTKKIDSKLLRPILREEKTW